MSPTVEDPFSGPDFPNFEKYPWLKGLMEVKAEIDRYRANIAAGRHPLADTAWYKAFTSLGVTFTPEQVEEIKSLRELGDTASAQAIILDALDKEKFDDGGE